MRLITELRYLDSFSRINCAPCFFLDEQTRRLNDLRWINTCRLSHRRIVRMKQTRLLFLPICALADAFFEIIAQRQTERLVPLPFCSEFAGANAGRDIAHARNSARRRRVCAIEKRSGRCIFYVIMRLHLQIHIFLNYRIITCTEYSLFLSHSFLILSFTIVLFFIFTYIFLWIFYYFYLIYLVCNIL